jgi:hypothetical protein
MLLDILSSVDEWQAEVQEAAVLRSAMARLASTGDAPVFENHELVCLLTGERPNGG